MWHPDCEYAVRMKKCALIVSLAGLVCLVAPETAHAGAPQYRQTQVKTHATMRHTPRAPRQDQVHRGGLDGSLTLIQFISTRKPHDERAHARMAPQHSIAQLRASRDKAGRESPATLTARPIDSMPAHWGATHLSI
jgi:hypothetical protein